MQTGSYEKLATEHADFLCNEVFKPAFIMGFVHGAKHAKVDVMSEDTCAAVAQKAERESLVSHLAARLEVAKEALRKQVQDL